MNRSTFLVTFFSLVSLSVFFNPFVGSSIPTVFNSRISRFPADEATDRANQIKSALQEMIGRLNQIREMMDRSINPTEPTIKNTYFPDTIAEQAIVSAYQIAKEGSWPYFQLEEITTWFKLDREGSGRSAFWFDTATALVWELATRGFDAQSAIYLKAVHQVEVTYHLLNYSYDLKQSLRQLAEIRTDKKAVQLMTGFLNQLLPSELDFKSESGKATSTLIDGVFSALALSPSADYDPVLRSIMKIGPQHLSLAARSLIGHILGIARRRVTGGPHISDINESMRIELKNLELPFGQDSRAPSAAEWAKLSVAAPTLLNLYHLWLRTDPNYDTHLVHPNDLTGLIFPPAMKNAYEAALRGDQESQRLYQNSEILVDLVPTFGAKHATVITVFRELSRPDFGKEALDNIEQAIKIGRSGDGTAAYELLEKLRTEAVVRNGTTNVSTCAKLFSYLK